MILTYDGGSLSSTGENNFEDRVIKEFVDKLRAGIDIPNYPQFRDMNKMFLEHMNGMYKTNDGYLGAGISIRPEKAEIPEVGVLKKRSSEIHEEVRRPFKLKVCITGPYTLASSFLNWSQHGEVDLLSQLGYAISTIAEKSIFSDKHGNVELLTLDEPLLGLVDDPLLGYGEGREALLKAWGGIFYKAKSRDVQTCIHLHSTSNGMFWGLKQLDIVESHVDDPLYFMDGTKKLLEENDKFLKASIGKTNFDTLIIAKDSESGLGDAWKGIHQGSTDPITYLEPVETMKKRLVKIINQFGEERVLYAGPECGLKGFPTYESAIEYLRRISEAAHSI